MEPHSKNLRNNPSNPHYSQKIETNTKVIDRVNLFSSIYFFLYFNFEYCSDYYSSVEQLLYLNHLCLIGILLVESQFSDFHP